MVNYKDKETGEIKTYREIQQEHNEIINNSSYKDEDLKDIKNISDFIKMFYIESEEEE